MTDKSAERRLDAAEPTQRTGAALARTVVLPPPANDNARPLLTRAIAGAAVAALLLSAAAFAYLIG